MRSEVVKPFRVKECQSNLECVLEWTKRAGDHYVVVGRVVAASIEDGVPGEEVSRLALDPIYHVGERQYTSRGPLLGQE